MTNRPRSRARWLWLAALCVVLGLVTSVGVAWGIAWTCQADLNRLSYSSLLAVQLVRSGDGTIERMSWSLARAATGINSGPLGGSGKFAPTKRDGEGCFFVINIFSAMPRAFVDKHISEGRTRDSVDLEAEFARLAGDAASKSALARHLPLLVSADGQHVKFSVTMAGWPVRCLAMEDACTREAVVRRKRLIFDIVYYGSHAGITAADRLLSPPGPAFNLLPHYNAIEVGTHLLPTFPLWPGLLADTGIFAGAWSVLIFTLQGVRHWLRARRARRGGCPQCGYSREGLKEGAGCPECGRGV